jgi:tetratricopeptide (TPR) repeat protein
MFTPALADLREAAYLRRNDVDVWLLIGKIYLQHFHDYDSAVNAATFASRLSPMAKEPYFIRAEAHLRGGDADMALHDYSKLIRLDPTDPWPWLFQVRTNTVSVCVCG